MTVDSGYTPSEREGDSRPIAQGTPAAQPVYYNSARHGNHVEESPELLRWRADLLMDEMMMGGVDVSAADGKRTFTGVDAPVVQRPPTSPTPANGTPSGNGLNSGRSPRDDYESRLYENGHHEAQRQDERAHRTGESTDNRNLHSNSQSSRPGSNGGSAYDAPTRNGNGFASAYDDYGNGHHEGERNGRGDEIAPRQSNSNGPAPRVDSQIDSQIRNDRPETYRAFDEPVRPVPTRPSPPTSVNGAGYQEGALDYRFDDEPGDRGRYEPRQSPGQSSGQSGGQTPAQAFNDQPPRSSMETRERASVSDQTLLRTPQDNVPVSSGGDQTARTDRLYSVEQQYEQFRREQVSNIQAVEPSSAAPRVYPDSAPQVSTPPQPVKSPPRVTPGYLVL